MSDLRRIRRALGMTQQQFADALGVGRSTVSAHERGALPVPRRTILAAVGLALWQVERARADAQAAAYAARMRRPFLR